MADAREHVPSGHSPFDPGPGEHGSNIPGAGDARSVKVNMGQGPPGEPAPARRPAPRHATASGAGMIASAVLALLFGGAGAWAYEHFLARPAAGGRPAGAAARDQDREADVRQDLAGMEDRMKDLSDRFNELAGQYKQLQARVESPPKPAPSPELAPIERKLAEVDRLAEQVNAINKKIDPLAQRLEQYDHRMTDLAGKLDALSVQETAARFRAPGSRDRQVSLARDDRDSTSNGADRSTEPAGADHASSSTGRDRAAQTEETESRPTPSPSGDRSEPANTALGSGAGLFHEKRYSEAYAAFRKLLQSEPDDARVWYYAALSYGLATNDWGRMTETMVEEGVSREKAGRPAKPEIDAAFSGLTAETGKDWLAFYRRRAG